MTLTSEQLAIRSKGIGASEIAAVCGIDPFRTPFDVWALKTGAVEKPPEEVYQRRGHLLEPVIVQLFEDRHPDRVAFQPPQPTLVHPVYPWVIATPDRFVAPKGTPEHATPEVEALLECKSKRSFVAHEWGEDGDPAGVPVYVVAQVQWQMAVTGLALVSVGLLLDGEEYREYTVHRDDAAIATLIDEGERFWTQNVQQGVVPELSGSLAGEYLQRRFREFTDVVAEASESANETMRRLTGMRARRKAIETEEERLHLALQAEVGDRKGIEGPSGRYLWGHRRGQVSYKAAFFQLGHSAEEAETFRGDSFRVPTFTSRGT